jgi:hypothetical protein
MINHKIVEKKLIDAGFEKVTQTNNGCWVNRTNGIVVYRGTYTKELNGKNNYTLCKGDNRAYIFSEDEFEKIYYELNK